MKDQPGRCDVENCGARATYILRRTWRQWPDFWVLRQQFTEQCDAHAAKLVDSRPEWQWWGTLGESAYRDA